jgi:hypothetical protein
MRLTVIIFSILAFLIGPGPAAADESVLNREGFWTVGRGQADSTVCFASLATKSGDIFALEGIDGEVSFALTTKRPLSRGKKGVFATDAWRFDFEPQYRDGILFLDDVLNARALAALRLARGVMIEVDGRVVFNAGFENTGAEAALDAVIACSKGQEGWWGKGVATTARAQPEAKAADAEHADRTVMNKEGAWTITVGNDPGVCIAQASVGGHSYIQFLSAVGQTGLAVGSDSPLRRGRTGRVETDAFSFDFKPTYGGERYLASDAPLDSQALVVLRRAKWIRVRVGGGVVVDAGLEGSGFADLLDSVAACSKGETGWWGDGARQP